ncbi:MAG: cell division protein FtsQ/DivIB [Gammaproteobacteria bacterium]|nr:cell division protein FtsQ/DivIB [Gammaproteobacteria bacterium]
MKVLLVLLVVSLMVWAGRVADDARRFPVNSIKVEGELSHVDRDELQRVVSRFMDRSFFVLDLNALHDALQRMSWIKTVSVRRIWPDTVHLYVTEHRPVAYWNEDELLSDEGVLFAPRSLAEEDVLLGALPVLSGPLGHQQEVMSQFHRFNALVTLMGHEVRRVVQNERRSWLLELNNGMKIYLGRSQMMSRLRRLVWAYQVLKTRFLEVVSVDLRYTNGFSVQREPS